MANAGNGGSAQDILDAIGGPENIKSMTHCATRLRFELNDAGVVDKDKLDQNPEVMGALPQSGDRYQVVIGGGVADMYNKIRALPAMAGASEARTVVKEKDSQSDAEVKAAARSKARGKHDWLDSFFEFLSDSFRPILGVLLGASLIIAFISIMEAVGVQDSRDPAKGASWVFLDAMFRSVFYFLPLMVAYNASKKLNVDGWVGFAVMGAVMTPEFMSLSDPDRFPDTTCVANEALGTQSCVAHVWGMPMLLNNYSGQVFVPLIMAAILALVYHGFKKIVTPNLQMVFVPFLSMIIMIPVTAFLIGPAGVWLANGLGIGLAWLNTHAPIVFSIIIPLLFPFLVPLGLHWPLNALMLVNIQTLGYDFIQGPMGAWNFACFGATAGVLILAIRQRDKQMRQVATGALFAGLLGGISEPSLYGIHLRYKRIYPRMLVGCLVGGVIIGIFGGVTTKAFAFTSLLTIPVFQPMGLYAIAVLASFVTAMVLVVISGFRTPEQQAEFIAKRDAEEAAARNAEASDDEAAAAAPAADGASEAASDLTGSGAVTTILSPANGELVALSDVNDPVFSTGVLGDGAGVIPSDGTLRVPLAGTAMTVADTGHAFGIKSDDGVEILVHVGIDTVKMNGEGFNVHISKGQRLQAGDPLVDVDLDAVKAAGYDTTIILAVTNTKAMTEVTPEEPGKVEAGDPVISVVH